ncbi:TlpA disulfide reductase family protein [Kiloniella laminariae]|uniref:TlpA disulfide reductase family protein n=1 Tax=Kiloniella laminariae TaxID=454162 RepID=A0ABT4LKM3_9PROT|nr:TlpA disulfide reductase family protein [Kiloniella laminariae]MCZ4281650.1 TlpA disulfide reductase family protein [Kiloniella laminariae]
MTLAYAYRVFFVSIGLFLAVFFLQITEATAENSDKPPLEGRLEGNFTLFDPPVPVPIESFEDEEGNLRSLKDFEGQVLLLNFWATWCPPCIKEMPDLDKLQAELGSDDFRVVTLSEDRGGLKQVLPFLNDNNLKNLPPYVDVKGRVSRAFGVRGLPSTYLIDKEGLIVGALIGPFEWSAPEVKKLIAFYTK